MKIQIQQLIVPGALCLFDLDRLGASLGRIWQDPFHYRYEAQVLISVAFGALHIVFRNVFESVLYEIDAFGACCLFSYNSRGPNVGNFCNGLGEPSVNHKEQGGCVDWF